MPWARAAAFTGLGRRARPRPAGRSGWVKTPTTSCGLATSRSSVGTANSGLPMNTTRAIARLLLVALGPPDGGGAHPRTLPQPASVPLVHTLGKVGPDNPIAL